MIKFLQGEELVQVINNYERKWDMPMCAGAIDGTHIRILAPEESHLVYINRKGYHSIIMQVAVDSNYIFRDVVGWPGSVHDAWGIIQLINLPEGQQWPAVSWDTNETNTRQELSPFIIGDPQSWSKILTHITHGSNNLTSSTLPGLFPPPPVQCCVCMQDYPQHWLGGRGEFQKNNFTICIA